MPKNSDILLPNMTHADDSAVQGATGEKSKADGYYSRSDGFHTVQYSLNGFIGTLYIQATLALDPNDHDWFNLPETVHTSSSTDDTESTGGFVYNFTGNYVWVRAIIEDWTDGTIKNVLFNH